MRALFYAAPVDPFRPLFARWAPWLLSPRWARLRAAWLLFHVVAVALVAFPAPIRRLDAAIWRKPAVGVELENWTKRLNSVGVRVTKREVRDFATELAARWLGARNTLVAPFKAYLGALGAPQNWYMFTGADRAPQRFALLFSDRNGTLSPVFELGVRLDHPELIDAEFLDEHRVRRALLQTSWSRAHTFASVCGYFARTLRAERGDVEEVICELRQQNVQHPGHLAESREVIVTRTLVVHADGSASDHWAPPKKRKKAHK